MRIRINIFVAVVIGIACSNGGTHVRSADTEGGTSDVRTGDRPTSESPGPKRFQRLWTIGTLDPARQQEWPTEESAKKGLASLPVTPQFVQVIARGNGGDPSNIDCYEASELAMGKSFTPRFGAGGKKSRLTLFVDLGRTMPGTIEIDATIPAGTKLTVETGEAMLPTRSYSVAPAPNGGRQVFRPAIVHGGWGSLRFAWIHFDGLTGPVVIDSVRGICQLMPCSYVGNFECSDEELTRVWEMCAYSAHAVMAQPLNNGTDRSSRLQTLCLDRIDRFPWMGDSRVIQTAVLDVFGQYDLVRSNLDGFIPKGRRPLPNSIAPYTLDWTLAVMDYYRCSGDAAYLRERIDDLTAVIDMYDALPTRWQDIQAPANQPIWMFFDWDRRIGRSIDEQTAAAFWGKYVQTCCELAEVAESVDCRSAAQHARELGQKHTADWRALYAAHFSEVYGVHAITNLILGGVLHTPEECEKAHARAFADRGKRWTNTPYFGTYVLAALAKLDRHTEAVEMLHDYWGTMIDAGATTVWEEWDPTMRLPVNGQPPQFGPPDTWGALSLIQPAGVGPARWLLREIVGIVPESPGCSQVRIEPNTAQLAWANGAMATPAGAVRASWKDSPARFQLQVESPQSMKVHAVVPVGRVYRVDGAEVVPQALRQGRAVVPLPGSRHSLEVEK